MTSEKGDERVHKSPYIRQDDGHCETFGSGHTTIFCAVHTRDTFGNDKVGNEEERKCGGTHSVLGVCVTCGKGTYTEIALRTVTKLRRAHI